MNGEKITSFPTPESDADPVPDDLDYRERRTAELVLDLDGFEGPIDLLLTLAREQKVDLTKISILALAEQYLDFIQQARRLRLEIAADYLVVAAWLAYLKSRLLLPASKGSEDEPTGEELAAALAFQLQRLEAMRDAGTKIFALPRLGRDVFRRGAPEGLRVVALSQYTDTLYDLLRAYGEIRSRGKAEPLQIEAMELYSMDLALERLSDLLGNMPDWTTLTSFLPPGLDGLMKSSAVAATFVASLELVRNGSAELRQEKSFSPLYVRRRQGRVEVT
ncbi:MAG: segregation and condensation protein A [Alphaproteobacteria bacterium]